MNKNKFWLSIGGLFIVGVIIYLFTSGQYINVVNALQTMDKMWLLYGLGLIGLYWFIESKIVHILVSKLHQPIAFKSALKVSMIGQFFSGITPFATGGQPAQLVLLSKAKVPVGKGSSILMSKFIVYQAVLVIYAAILLLLKAKMFLEKVDNIFTLVLIGFGVNFAVIAGLIFISTAKRTNEKLSGKIINLLYKFKIIKEKGTLKEKIKSHLSDFHDQVALMAGHKHLVVKTVLLTILQLTAYFLVPYCLYRGFGLSGVSVINIVAATAFVLMVTSFVPMPGGSGGAEGGFYLIFGMFFIPKLIVPAILLWRVITYYLWMFIGGMWMLTSKVNYSRS